MDLLPLQLMPSISIDLPMTNHGYEVKADDVFWVQQGVLRSTDLRDSADEQCIADILACVVGDEPIERSKDALDEIYFKGTAESERVLTALEVYGAAKASDEIKYCIDEILKVCDADPAVKLRGLLFRKTNTNAFPSVFSIVLLAFHKLIVEEGKKISNYSAVKEALRDLSTRIETGTQRRKDSYWCR